ncbi:MAG: glucose-6-phosphate isomerase, partial [Eubacteriales bacterium]|nr:glucose-6-phosphate isomerase [Eubacteriales bacterium]
MNLNIELKNSRLEQAAVEARRGEAQQALAKLFSGQLDFTGWVKDPLRYDEAKIKALTDTAAEIRAKCDYFIVLGVGGSFMGAKAVIDMLPEEDGTKVLFAGYNFSGRYLKELMKTIEGREIAICVISKSGSTTETLSAYGIFKEIMLEKYGKEETAKRTYVVTETRSNYLFDQASEEGCTIFDLAVDIGGRYSVLTPVGLLPIAVAGIDIGAMLRGAAALASQETFAGTGLDYAITRQLLSGQGKKTEIFEFFDPYLAYFGEWL